jgi:hypothetical protein
VGILTTVVNNPDVVIGTVLFLILALFIVRALRSSRPDPESARLLWLLNQLPNQEDAASESLLAADERGGSDSPLGPSSFSLLTSNAQGLGDGHSAAQDRSQTGSRSVPAAPSPTKAV